MISLKILVENKCKRVITTVTWVYIFIFNAFSISLYRVKQIVGFDAEDLIGQEMINFFHPKEMNSMEHTKCRKMCKFCKGACVHDKCISRVCDQASHVSAWKWSNLFCPNLCPSLKQFYQNLMENFKAYRIQI